MPWFEKAVTSIKRVNQGERRTWNIFLYSAQCPHCQLGITFNRTRSDQYQIVSLVVRFTKRFVLSCLSQSKDEKDLIMGFSNSNFAIHFYNPNIPSFSGENGIGN